MFFQKLWIWKNILKKEKLQHNCGILPQTNSWIIKINQSIYHYEILWWLTCLQFQVDAPLLNPLKISENQRFRFSDVFKGYRHGEKGLKWVFKNFWEFLFLLFFIFYICFFYFILFIYFFWLTMIECHLGETSNEQIYNESFQLLLWILFFGFYKFWLQIA